MRLFKAGYLERLRPTTRHGSYEWTYWISKNGFDLVFDNGLLSEGSSFVDRSNISYSYVIHDLELNGWLLALRSVANDDLEGVWGEAESALSAPDQVVKQGRLAIASDWLVGGIRMERALSVYPDACVQLSNSGPAGYVRYLIEYDRTKRADELRDKLCRYDLLLNWWWQLTDHGENDRPPQLLFVCKDQDHLDLFLRTADQEMEGHRKKSGSDKTTWVYRGREWTYFTLSDDIYDGSLNAWQVPAQPTEVSGHPYSPQETSLVR